MTYIELLRALEQRLGYQHLPLDPHASTVKNLFDSTPVHHELMQRLTQALFHGNHCRTLTDSVQRDACFDVMGTIRQETLKTTTTDVEVYRLLDDLCQMLDELFAEVRQPGAVEEKHSADIVPFTPGSRRNNK